MSTKSFAIACLFIITGLMLIRCRRYEIAVWKVFPLAISVAMLGLLGTKIMFFLENGFWYGKSFFGAVLFFPILLLPLTLLFRIKLLNLLGGKNGKHF